MPKLADPIKQSSTDKTWYFRANVGFNEKTGKRVQIRRSGFRTKKEAREEYNTVMAAGATPDETNLKEIQFSEFVDTLFLPWYKGRVKDYTFRTREYCRKLNLNYFDDMLVSKITSVDVMKWQNELNARASNAYTRINHCLLSQIFKQAVIMGYAKENPAKVVGNVRKIKKQISFWTLQEFETFISSFDITDYQQHFLFISYWLMFFTGLRLGEATGLFWDDIDFEQGTLQVERTLHFRSVFDYDLSDPKTVASRRVITLDTTTLQYLKEWHARQKDHVSSDFVISQDGVPIGRGKLDKPMKDHTDELKLKAITLHGFRHSHAALLISLKENPLMIKDRLGHTDVQTTLGVYGHLYPNSNTEMAQRLNGLVTYKPKVKEEAVA
ncbi:site-specific integrase [Lacticaseibacillus manihotivorans]|uniref:Integrase n=2 Tax=Lacticaseibacillus manihotivorans TaxID=88233 RepID=A0A0R1QGQ3_9LACO|nr:site-specific integrase [Lacticaseibacillus manihotivorans]KRL44038.1 Integrase [Lacticaseibacillus manihotivorans DSM 13343 = JCM 12514]QFQ90579.1 tyrosine-type recombinase/integrase [Lacticaseibacillus manihotivorans]